MRNRTEKNVAVLEPRCPGSEPRRPATN